MYDSHFVRDWELPPSHASSHLRKLCPLNMVYSNSSSPLGIDRATGMAEVTLTSDESRALVAMLGQTRELTPTLSSLLVRLQGVLSPPTSMPIIPEAGMSYSVQVSRNRWDNLFLDESIYEVTSRGSLHQEKPPVMPKSKLMLCSTWREEKTCQVHAFSAYQHQDKSTPLKKC